MRPQNGYMLLRTVSAYLLTLLIQACCPVHELDAEFRRSLDALGSHPIRFGRADREEIDYLSARILAERNPDRKALFFAVYSNTVVNVSIIRTNNLVRTQQIPRGIIIGPYRNTVGEYRDFVNAAFEKVRGTNTFDHFCLELEIWKRLNHELAQSDRLMEFVARSSVVYNHEALADSYKHEAKMTLSGEMLEIEDHLEHLYRNESEESRRAYELFREVIGREAIPRYKR